MLCAGGGLQIFAFHHEFLKQTLADKKAIKIYLWNDYGHFI